MPEPGPDGQPRETRLRVDRPAVTLEELHIQCTYDPPKPPGLREKISKSAQEATSCSREKICKMITDKIPILSWLSRYDIKEWLLGDVIAGVTVAIMHIPLGMAFALLAHLPAICGIYMAFYQVLIYAFLATSQHNSMGSFAVITLMTGKVVKELATFPVEGAALGIANATSVDILDEITYTPIQIATVVTFMVGVWHMIFGILQLGTLSVFLSDMLVSGFTTAAAFHVLTSQIKDLLGIKIQGFSGPFKIIYTYIEIIKALPDTNIACVIIAAIAITFLFVCNELIKPRLAKYTRIPIPSELLVVIVATLASLYGNFNEQYGVKIVGHIPTGLPPAQLPPFELLGRVSVDSLVIAIVSYAIDFSLAKIFALRKGYTVDATQELYAHGLSNIGSSFFACPPMAAAFARSLIQEAVGGVTQVASFVTCAVILIVLLFIGPFFETLPNVILASVIAVALKGMFMQVKDFINMWSVSRIDAMCWMVTCLAVIVIDIDLGLLIGVVFSLFVLLARNQSPSVLQLGRISNTDLYLDAEAYPEVKALPGIVILKIVGSIHFANRDNIKNLIMTKSRLNSPSTSQKNTTSDETMEMEGQKKNALQENVTYLILDLSGISYVDSAGSKFMAQLHLELAESDIKLCLAGSPDMVVEALSRSGVLTKFPKSQLYHSTHDAVTMLTHTQ